MVVIYICNLPKTGSVGSVEQVIKLAWPNSEFIKVQIYEAYERISL